MSGENRVLLGCYAGRNGNTLPTFRDNLSVPNSWALNLGPIICCGATYRSHSKGSRISSKTLRMKPKGSPESSQQITTTCCEITHKTAVLRYFEVEAWNYLNIGFYTGCPRRNGHNFGRVFLMLNYIDITQNTYIQSWTVTEIMAREKCGLLTGSTYCTCTAGWHVTRISMSLRVERTLSSVMQ